MVHIVSILIILTLGFLFSKKTLDKNKKGKKTYIMLSVLTALLSYFYLEPLLLERYVPFLSNTFGELTNWVIGK